MDLDKWIETAKKCELLPENDIRSLCEMVKDILAEESNVQPVNSPVTISGDIHGQFFDMLELLKHGGDCPGTRYIFMGDFVDRGHHSVETLQLLLLLKARFPDCVTLLRGNHESRQVTRVYGFYEEVIRKYGNANVWKYCTDVFDYFALSAVVDGRIYAVHGGLSPDISTIDQVRMVERKQEIPHQGSFCDLVWSDPEDIETWKVSPRGAGWLFGSKVTTQFNYINRIELITRAHQLVQEGFKYMFPEKNLITVWSAPNYCYRCGNVASILVFDEHLDRQIKLFTDVAESKNFKPEQHTLPYFM